ncbi:GGDEF domain-containing protein [Marinibactrum halimedae]|uniref:Diguanylate cyclase n=1 Tax=Marinibactrum halimedae TaxID=1444977 RepID=A0AA37WLB3_9GAMM|nr:GGDEF domain-containing protein [Marinibactrum halimedae]MCD9459319.1 GGDEF domain-containing protein [Marinibactrum halimedae]GLS25789.1 diguanylate cyclase [Marinibactrum halimedae]
MEQEAQHVVSALQDAPLGVIHSCMRFLGRIEDFFAVIDREGCFVAVNANFARAYQSTEELIIGRNIRDIMEEEEFERLFHPYLNECFTGTDVHHSSNFDFPGLDESMHMDVGYYPLFDESGEVHAVLLTFHDVTTFKNMERKLRQLAHLDPLTQMPNLRFIDYQLNKLQARCERQGEGFSLLYIDFNQFKSINDEYGHNAGDQVLVEFGRRLRSTLRRGEFISRIGGDEFLVVVSEQLSEEAGIALQERIKSMLYEPITITSTLKLRVSVSVGMAVWPTDGRDLATLKAIADERMYRDKKPNLN